MIELLRNSGGILIENFISPEDADLYFNHLKTGLKENPKAFHYDQVRNSPSIKNEIKFLNLLIRKTHDLSEFLNINLIPTYTYCRLYQHDGYLTPHKDRPACEISVTVHLGSDGVSWPLGFKNPNGENIFVDLKPGQAVVYLGTETLHWREGLYKGQEYGQAFLHYVDAEGPNHTHYFDNTASGSTVSKLPVL